MDSGTIRRKFLEFFEKKEHKIVPSAPLVLKNDPTLLFTNSGMVQFKDNFLGNSKPVSNRVADTQKCLRVSGKHNDLEDVGLDTYHHTMFEMLGNWSFGDYFKKDAIAWAWELLTEEYKLPKERLYVTVFGGDKGDKLPVDTDAEDLWKQFVQEDRILHGIKKDNFWEMGEQGPCGPCSEIHIDLRSDEEIKNKPGRELVNSDHPQVVEIWNLVFMEFNRKADGSLEKLPAQHVDTGMGFERLCMAIQKKTSNYDTDVFRPLMDFIALNAGVTYQRSTPGKGAASEKQDIAIRVMADHIRAVSFTIADGQLPSNTGAGYVIRRILRRAVRYGFSYLNFKEPFIHRLVPLLANQLKEVFPELHKQVDFVTKVVHEEEISFLRTLGKGISLLNEIMNSAGGETKNPNGTLQEILNEGLSEIDNRLIRVVIPGALAFELFDTFGFPFDLTSLIARERGFSVDEKGFHEEMAKQKARSKADATKEISDWILHGDEGSMQPLSINEYKGFVGYDKLEITTDILKYRTFTQKGIQFFEVVLCKTPFYAESGGQVGDTGFLELSNGTKLFVENTKKDNGIIVHYIKIPNRASDTSVINASVLSNVKAQVNTTRRRAIERNHSATHLLHATLREIVGKHVEQRGSLVNEKLLRFDFSHFAPLTTKEIRMIERIVNQKIRSNYSVKTEDNVPISEARAKGAMALFGEKYGELVRVVTINEKNNFSIELCGGTHVSATGRIGLFKIISESSVAAGIRRIEAVTGGQALNSVNESIAVLNSIKTILKGAKDVPASLQSLLEEKHALEKKLEQVNTERANQIKDVLASKAVKSASYHLILERVSVPSADALKNIAYALRNQFDDLLLILAADVDGKPQVAVMIGEKLLTTNKFHAGNLVKELAKEIDGGGGGQPFFATAGGKNLDGLNAVLEKARRIVNS